MVVVLAGLAIILTIGRGRSQPPASTRDPGLVALLPVNDEARLFFCRPGDSIGFGRD